MVNVYKNKFFIFIEICTFIIEFNGLVSKRAVSNDGSFSVNETFVIIFLAKKLKINLSFFYK